MFRKISSVFLMFAACLIMQAVEILPHHHHDVEVVFFDDHCCDLPLPGVCDGCSGGHESDGKSCSGDGACDHKGADRDCSVRMTYLAPATDNAVDFHVAAVSLIFVELFSYDTLIKLSNYDGGRVLKYCPGPEIIPEPFVCGSMPLRAPPVFIA